MNKYTYKEQFHQTVPVSPGGYDCFVTDGFESFSEAMSGFSFAGHKAILVNEHGYGGFYLDTLSKAVTEAGGRLIVVELPETVTDLSPAVSKMQEAFQTDGFDNEDFVLSLGGVLADAAARLFSVQYAPRIRYIKIPVTFLGQLLAASPIDAQIDVDLKSLLASCNTEKGAEDLFTALRRRNPDLVYINILAYKNLSETDRISGLGEVLRIGAGYDKELFQYVENLTGRKTNDLFEFLMNVTLNCLQFGSKHAWKDDGTKRIPLIGEEIGAALEKCTNYIIPHGQAVSIGLVVAASLSNKRGVFKDSDHMTLARTLASHGFVILMNFTNDLIDAICAQLPNADAEDPKEGFLLPERIGKSRAVQNVTPDEIRSAMNYR